MLTFKGGKGSSKQTIGFDTVSCVSLLLHMLEVWLIGSISKDAAGFERICFPDAPHPTAGIILDGRMSATCM